jgi:alkanesulfonate monooxygenase SsuD/methylene tetrahydromethanopterin reductase-like flavin-dependent oxidoreductase (luciferase family)
VNFGIQTGQQHRSYDDLLSAWLLAERLGFSHAWLYDHLIPVGGDPAGPVFEAWTLLASLLSRTERIRGGILVTCVQYRNAGVLAKEAVTVDHASGGRLEFGIGSCWNAWEAGLYGIGFPPLAARNDNLEEAIALARAVWAGTAAPLPSAPRPVNGTIPVWVGGTGARSTRIVARAADGWNVVFTTYDEYAEHLARVRASCEEFGRDPAALRLSFGQRVVVEDTHERAEQRAREMYDRSGVPWDDYVRARVVFGTAAGVAEQVARFRDLGVEQFILWYEPPIADARPQEQIERFARDVVPLL